MKNTYRRGNGTYILSKEEIDFEAEYILSQYYEKCLLQAQPTPIENLIEKMGLTLKYNRLSNDLSVLGAFVFNKGLVETFDDDISNNIDVDDRTIIIDSILAETEDPRLVFTYGHELGHYVTQYDLIHINKSQISLFDDNNETQIASICKREFFEDSWFNPQKKKLVTKEDWMEWQANYFASAILIPKSSLRIELEPLINQFDPFKDKSIFDNLDGDVMEYISELCSKYNVTFPLMVNRLKSLGYMESR